MFDKHFGTLQSPGVRADAQCFKFTWLEELALERNIIQASEDIAEAGKIAGPDLIDFMIRGRLTRILGRFRAQGSALTRNVSHVHARSLPWCTSISAIWIF